MQATDVSMCSLCRKNILAHDFMTDVGGTACQDVNQCVRNMSCKHLMASVTTHVYFMYAYT